GNFDDLLSVGQKIEQADYHQNHLIILLQRQIASRNGARLSRISTLDVLLDADHISLGQNSGDYVTLVRWAAGGG
ncbi:MAG: hypothetical protein ACP5M1_12800, partial [Acidiphilium sp.]